MRPVLLSFLCCLSMTLMAQQDSIRAVRTFEPYRGAVEKAPMKEEALITTSVPARQGGRPGQVTVVAEPRVEELMKAYTEKQDELKGFRVQIFLGPRDQANPVRVAFLQKHPDTPAYLSYLAPNFRVRVGDCRDRLEAEKLLQEVRSDHPGSYIVQDDIEMPRLED